MHDAALIRLMAYSDSHSDYGLHGTLAPADLKDAEIAVYSDADLSGDPATTKSTTGFGVKLYAPSSGSTWPLS